MCLAVPGKILSIRGDTNLTRKGQVGFSGVSTEVNLAYVPQAKVGDFVVVHVGFALSVVDEAEAKKLLQLVEEIEHLGQAEGEAVRP